MRNEIDIHAALGPSLNVCTLFTCYEDDLEVHLVLEQCSGGMLWDRCGPEAEAKQWGAVPSRVLGPLSWYTLVCSMAELSLLGYRAVAMHFC